MSYRDVIVRTIEGETPHGVERLRLPSAVVSRDGREYVGDEEVETVVVDVHKTIRLGDTVLAEEWDFRRDLTFGECKEIERLYGGPMATFEENVDLSMAARTVLILVLLKRQNPQARMSDIDAMPRSAWSIETTYTDPAEPVAVGPTEGASPAPEPADETDDSSSSGETTTSGTSPTSSPSDPGSGTA